MEQGFKKRKIGILGGGPSGCCVAYFLKDFCDVTLIDYSQILRTILPTGGGRCNLANAEYDFRELVKNYPRGEKFLYSIFSKFSTADTIDLFKKLGINTYTQDDNRIFPTSNMAKDVQMAFINSIKNDVLIKNEKGLRIEILENTKIKLVTDMETYLFDSLVIATGGHNGYELLSHIGIDIVSPCPALVGFVTKQNFKSLSGVSLKDVSIMGLNGDLLFTHKGVSGPLIYKISSIKARDKRPYNLSINLYPNGLDLQNLLNLNPHKQINNLLSDIFPKKLSNYLLDISNIDKEMKCHLINGKKRDVLLDNIYNFKLTIIDVNRDGEVVTAGGVSLKEVNSKTLESKKFKSLYFVGEVLDIDGFCGGYNLQNCWSTAYVVSSNILNS